MPVHSLLIIDINKENNLLYSKYFDHDVIQALGAPFIFEKRLKDNTKPIWTSNIIESGKKSCFIDNIYCVYEKVNEIIIFVNGTEDYDEIILSSVLDTIKFVIYDILDVKIITIKDFMNSSKYGKFCVSIDDLMPDVSESCIVYDGF